MQGTQGVYAYYAYGVCNGWNKVINFSISSVYKFIFNFISPETLKDESSNDGGPKLPLAKLLNPYCSFGTPKMFLSILLL